MGNIRLAFVVALTGYGIWGITNRIINSKPRSTTCAEYLSSRPNTAKHRAMQDEPQLPFSNKDWIELTDCEIDVAGIIYAQTLVLGRIKKVYLPVHPLGASRDGFTRLLICSTSPNDIQLAKELRNLGSGDKSSISADLVRHMKERGSQRTVKGMVNRGAGFIEGIKLERTEGSLSDGFVLLDEGQTPSLLPAICSLIAGVLLALTFFLPVHDPPSQEYAAPTPPPLP